ncbi:exodeoxyribonuclease VII small subunit [Pelomonas sp. CA6]|mgnify:CR=1 FL=1|uniref:exodeoxyribonuclease VII small subunit n=1 Tax=Pelomonas sp. CA6 TaxID=2907999 RepID=UPI001F4B1738|nr:exodeoxyribonuclease VII small subunit [Pelomonas sp. CA6]MCH7342071.1 exodeoxyribonuclease VII small subunit [Pelomonas sp. CA6]
MSKATASAKPAAAASDTDRPVAASYEQALAELERLVSDMETGQLPLDQLLASHRRGAELLNYCRTQLQVVEQQVRLVEGNDVKPWEDS